MKEKYTYLDELTDKSHDFKVKVKVIQKARPTQSPTKRYQRIKFVDDKGNEMRGTLFEDDISKFEQALQQGGEYEISRVPIRPVPEQYQIRPNEFQMNFNDRVKVIPINTEATVLSPKYHNITFVPRNADITERFALIGIVLFAEETRTIRKNKREQQVREILLTDHSVDRPMVISLWDDLARSGSDALNAWAQSFMVVGFTDMQISNHRGFSLRSSISTAINIEPDYPKAHALRNWAKEKEAILHSRRAKAMNISIPSEERIISTIAQVLAKKVSDTWQQERFWIKAMLPDASLKNLRNYLGCNICGRRTESEENATFNCSFCKNTGAVSTPRVNFAFDVVDATGAMKFTIFNDDVEQLFGMSCEDLIALKHAEQSEVLPEEVIQLREKEVLFQLGPTSGLSTSQMLKWTVRAVVME